MYFDFRWMILPPHAPKRFLCSSYFRKNSYTNQNIKKQAVNYNATNHLFYKNNYGAPKGIRTPDLQIRSLPLYPAELWARRHLETQFVLFPSTSPLDNQGHHTAHQENTTPRQKEDNPIRSFLEFLIL